MNLENVHSLLSVLFCRLSRTCGHVGFAGAEPSRLWCGYNLVNCRAAYSYGQLRLSYLPLMHAFEQGGKPENPGRMHTHRNTGNLHTDRTSNLLAVR